MNYGEVLSSFLIDLQRLFRVEISDKNVTYSQVLALVSIPDEGIDLRKKVGCEENIVI